MKNTGFIVVLAVASGLLLFVKTAPAADTKVNCSHKGHMMEMDRQMADMNRKMVKMLGKPDAQYDLRFIDMMIPHHEGAILMAQDALKNSNHQEIRDLAQKIIDAQKKEIEQLKQWRKQWYGK